MDVEDLRRRRAELQLRNARKAQLLLIRELVEALDAAGVAYEMIWSEAERSPGDDLLAGWPIPFRVDWARVPGAEVREWADDAEADRLLAAALDALAKPDDAVTFIWTNGLYPGVRLPAREAARFGRLAARQSLEVWLCGPGGVWLVELRRDLDQIGWASRS